jgi:hypothetical protein
MKRSQQLTYRSPRDMQAAGNDPHVPVSNTQLAKALLSCDWLQREVRHLRIIHHGGSLDQHPRDWSGGSSWLERRRIIQATATPVPGLEMNGSLRTKEHGVCVVEQVDTGRRMLA